MFTAHKQINSSVDCMTGPGKDVEKKMKDGALSIFFSLTWQDEAQPAV